ncbi:thrombospondin type-1 domain-containing protein 7B [Sphaerodactylus townsendi]|uniref:thrombospondin type-1 domain-containing protein 7B n=1 Tax=Sphaerodactylus townsendi TaxID=933632 RepID=UPI002026B810|nr:thrombospondin type-1 domain-containing protein 7B [Sphaerodactylus townsendi]
MFLRNSWLSAHWAWQSSRSCLVVLALLLLHTSDLEGRKSHQFVWKTGHWGRCIGDCGSGGVQSRVVWCVHSEGWTTHHSNCEQSDRPDSQRSCFKICDWHLELFEWEVSEWHMCVLVPFAHGEVKPRTSECVTAQHGLQHRHVQCVQKLNRTVVSNEICEHFIPQPPMEQACLIPCPRDCVVSQFSSWSVCRRHCGKRLQHRTRSVIAPPLYGGAKCPNLTESRTCNGFISCSHGEEEYTYSLKVGSWSKCRLPHLKEMNMIGRTSMDFSLDSTERSTFKLQVVENDQNFHRFKLHLSSKSLDIEIGYQTRQVRCTRSDGKNVMLSLCVQEAIPLNFQSCVMPKECETSDWSSWSSCSKTCHTGDLSPGFRIRTRNITHIATGAGKECPETEEREACNIGGGRHLHPCPRYSWRTSEWKECDVSLLLEQQDPQHQKPTALCGGGIQVRKVYCAQSTLDETHKLKEVTRPVENKLCLVPAPPSSQLCNIQCPPECRVSSWSAWGPCVLENCHDTQGKKGFKMRERRVIVEPVDTSGEDVSDDFCSEVPSPSGTTGCEVPCGRDCVVTEWSQWSSCSHSCSGKNAEGKQSRTRSILALPGEGGKACPSSQALQEYRSCNDHSCNQVYWETSVWNPCSENTLITSLNATINWNGEATCGMGIQTRKVFCVKNNSGQVPAKRCPESIRPETVRPCLLTCKKDCVVTPFSEWTSCPTVCQHGNSTTMKQSRYRIIIQDAVNGGQECPDTLFEERECENIPLCPAYSWKIHKWGQCVLVPDSIRQGILGVSEPCGHGLQSRVVTCVMESNHSVDIGECLKWVEPMPSLVQECLIPCKDDCTFTPWSKFTSCSSDCGSTRTRRRTLTGRSRKRDKCQNTELYPQVETEQCPCSIFTTKPHGNWSECIISVRKTELQLEARFHGHAKECGEGVRFQALACYDKTGRLVEHSHCNHSGYIEEPCMVPCPFDCKLSDWSAWTPCSSTCGTGVRTRSRWLKEKPYNGGRPCPKLDPKNQVYEAIPCYSECSQYSWETEPWSPCEINSEQNSLHCGEGRQTRKIRCINTPEEGEEETVANRFCNQSEIPLDTQKCTLYCPSECVVSEWGRWTQCPQPCDSNIMQTRTRRLLRSPVHPKTCPEDSQMWPCVLNQNCFHYYYNVTDWSTCQLSKNAICGEGIKNRLLSCVRSDGKTVTMNYCEQLNLEKPAKMIAHCLVECVVNCQLSEWSAWSECSHSCGLSGQMLRTRSVIMQAQGEGRLCPAELTQYRNCAAKPCYSLVLGEWSPCRVEGGQCGDGIQVRNLTCMVHNGSLSAASKQVESSLCGDLPSKESVLLLPCSVPCPGDCHLTEWSEWSSCELTCIDGRSFESTGRQSRSRTFIIQSFENQDSCPEQELETRPCSGGKCYNYVWKASLWQDNERTVWCQRSDGVNVTGGCSIQRQPTTTRHCSPACKKPFSYCTQSGVCGCKRGYTEIMRSDGFLDYCMKIPGLEDKKADVKTNAAKNKPINSKMHDIFKGWSIQPFNPDGKLKIWVYGVSAGGFFIIVSLIFTSYLLCKKPKQQQHSPPQQKCLTLAYDGDVDM